MILYRLKQDWGGLPAGACVSEEAFKRVYYLDKPLFEPIADYEIQDMIEYEDPIFCIDHNIEKMLFYTDLELDMFINKFAYGSSC